MTEIELLGGARDGEGVVQPDRGSRPALLDRAECCRTPVTGGAVMTVARCCCRRHSTPTPPEPEGPVIGVTFVTTAPGQQAVLGPVSRQGLPDGTPPSVDWGDGTSEDVPTGSSALTHIYAQPGTYHAFYRGISSGFGGDGGSVEQMQALTSVDRWDVETMGSAASIRLNYAFANAINLVSVVTPPGPINSLMYSFQNARSFNQSLADWDLSQCTIMSYAFRDAVSFNQDCPWQLPLVTSITNCFSGAVAFNGNVSSWGLERCTALSFAFWNASSFNQPLDTWDTAAVISMTSVFNGATVFNQPLPSWNTARVTNMSSMFQNAKAFNQDLSGWDVDQVTSRLSFNSGANPDWVANAAWQPQWPA